MERNCTFWQFYNTKGDSTLEVLTSLVRSHCAKILDSCKRQHLEKLIFRISKQHFYSSYFHTKVFWFGKFFGFDLSKIIFHKSLKTDRNVAKSFKTNSITRNNFTTVQYFINYTVTRNNAKFIETNGANISNITYR